MISVIEAPPFVTVQDLGRPGYRADGVPPSGAADTESMLALNALLGNYPDAALLEWAVASGELRFDSDALIALGGAEVVATLNGKPVERWTAMTVAPGDELRVERFVQGRFVYVAVRGGLDIPLVLGSRSTLLSAAFGGLEGRRLRTGDVLRIGDVTRAPAMMQLPDLPRRSEDHSIAIMRGPQADLFDSGAWTAFLDAEFIVSRASDRSGYRLEGPSFEHRGEASLPSEPTCVGAIQIPHGGAPIVLMHDGPTVGGYPKIAVIKSRCIARFAQLAPGDSVRFALES